MASGSFILCCFLIKIVSVTISSVKPRDLFCARLVEWEGEAQSSKFKAQEKLQAQGAKLQLVARRGAVWSLELGVYLEL